MTAVLSSDFLGLRKSAASLASSTFAASLASTTSTTQLYHSTSWSWWFDHPWHQNDQYYCSLLWNGSSKVQFLTDRWYPFSLCYFFENWFQISKFHNLMYLKVTLYLRNYQSWYLSEPMYFKHFNVRHPVHCSDSIW